MNGSLGLLDTIVALVIKVVKLSFPLKVLTVMLLIGVLTILVLY